MFLKHVRRFITSERGDTIVQFVFVLPIFLILVFGSYEVWKVVHLKQALEGATIQAARYLSVEGPYLMKEPPGYPLNWQQRAWEIIYTELSNEPLLQGAFDPNQLQVAIDAPFGRPQCPGQESSRPSEAERRARRAQFAIRSRIPVQSPLRIPFVTLPETLELVETHWHYLECGPNAPPTPNPD